MTIAKPKVGNSHPWWTEPQKPNNNSCYLLAVLCARRCPKCLQTLFGLILTRAWKETHPETLSHSPRTHSSEVGVQDPLLKLCDSPPTLHTSHSPIPHWDLRTRRTQGQDPALG